MPGELTRGGFINEGLWDLRYVKFRECERTLHPNRPSLYRDPCERILSMLVRYAQRAPTPVSCGDAVVRISVRKGSKSASRKAAV